ncbi:hypothetical protein [Aurantimonas sp. Leaf443]|uniref:hypothetical protein n=1 Tax=Aurantimonas sp. Leaf443 TaxID=1736378 RepID=UPI00070006A6|nr:hypothetical protein [Aurantimonas sp. Leaf443]KQT82183.1 hypothetical protein ASG48_16215 [Aurantimonas sp. Leaf443]
MGHLARDFSRRVALQALVSGTAMLALQVTFGGGDGLQRLVFGEPAPVAQASREDVPAASASGAAQTPGTAPARKAARVAGAAAPAAMQAVPARAEIASPAVRAASVAPARIEAPASGRGAATGGTAEGVLLFTDCKGRCESRDPLLLRPARLRAGTTPADELAPPSSLRPEGRTERPGIALAEAVAADEREGWLPRIGLADGLGALAGGAGQLVGRVSGAAISLLP